MRHCQYIMVTSVSTNRKMSQGSESQLNRSASREHSFASEITHRLYESVDFAKHHERELVAAGVIVLGAAAVITHTGALAKLLSLGKSAITDGVAIDGVVDHETGFEVVHRERPERFHGWELAGREP